MELRCRSSLDFKSHGEGTERDLGESVGFVHTAVGLSQSKLHIGKQA